MTTTAALPVERFHLDMGSHGGRFTGKACVNELGSILAGEPWGYRLGCQDQIVGDLLASLNDRLPDEPRQLLAPYMLRSLGTANDGRHKKRRQMLNEWLLHRALPPFLDLAGLEDAAQGLSDLPVDLDVEAARQAIRSARDQAWSARENALTKFREAVRSELGRRRATNVAASAEIAASAAGAAIAAIADDADGVAIAASTAVAAIADSAVITDSAASAAIADVAASAAIAHGAAIAAIMANPHWEQWWAIRDAVYKAINEKLDEQLTTKFEKSFGPVRDELFPGVLDLLDLMLPPEPAVDLTVSLECAKVICGVERDRG